jgi:hypothetical protein
MRTVYAEGFDDFDVSPDIAAATMHHLSSAIIDNSNPDVSGPNEVVGRALPCSAGSRGLAGA